jgi:hypothetical protein
MPFGRESQRARRRLLSSTLGLACLRPTPRPGTGDLATLEPFVRITSYEAHERRGGQMAFDDRSVATGCSTEPRLHQRLKVR